MVQTIGARFSGQISGSSWGAFQKVYGSMELEFCDNCVTSGWGWAYGDHHIKFDGMYNNPETAARFITHEFGHIFDRSVCAANNASGRCGDIFAKTGTARADLTGNMGTCGNSPSCLGRKGHEGPLEGEYWGWAGGWEDWQYGQDDGTGEVWADMFVGWTFNTWGGDTRGTNRQGYMNSQMLAYLVLLSSR